MTTVLNLEAKKYTSRVLDGFIAQRGAHARIAAPNIQAFGENSTTSNLTLDELARALGAAGGTIAGPQVNETTAMKVTAVYGCVALIAGAISTLPINIYERQGGSRREIEHEYQWMLNEQANEDMTTATAMEFVLMSKLLYGDGFARWLRPSPFSNRVIGWQPLHPDRVIPFRDQSTGRLYYRVTPMAGDGMGEQIVLDPADIMHIPSLGFDGLRSPSAITFAAREAIGNALAAEEFTGRFFSQGANFDVALTTDQDLTDDHINQLRTSYLARQAGGRNSRIPIIMSGGLKVQTLSITPADAELLPSRAFTVQEICRVFGVPPHMIGHTETNTSWGAGIEQQGIGFVKYTLRRHLTPITQEINRKLWPTRAKYFVGYNVADLERGDLKARFDAHRIAVGGPGSPGILTVNEVRRSENYPPIDGGDKLHTGIGPAKVADATNPKPAEGAQP